MFLKIKTNKKEQKMDGYKLNINDGYMIDGYNKPYGII